MDESPSERQARRVEMAIRLLSVLYVLVSLAGLLWSLTPEHQRRLVAMQAAAKVRRVTGTLASRTGRRAMRLELDSSVENYALPYALSLARDKAGAVYDKLRYTA